MIAYLLNIGLMAVLLGGLYLRQEKEFRKVFLSALTLKVVAGLGFAYFYVSQGSGDTLTYFDAAAQWRALYYQDPSVFLEKFFFTGESISGFFGRQPRALFLTKLTAVFSILTFGNYYLTTLYFSVLSFLASWYLFVRLCNDRPSGSLAWFSALFLLPGVIFWASGVMKETFVLSGLYLLAGAFLDFKRGKTARYLFAIVLTLIGGFLVIRLKYYVAAVFMPLLLAGYYLEFSSRMKWLSGRKVKYILPVLLLAVSVLFVVNLSPNFRPGNLLERIVNDHDRLSKRTDEAYRIDFENLQPEIRSFVMNAPNALLSGLFRPFVWEGRSFLQVMAGLQNLLLAALVLLAIWLAISGKSELSSITWLLILYSTVMAAFLAFATPNFGTLERYKVLYQPFLLLALADAILFLRQQFKTPT